MEKNLWQPPQSWTCEEASGQPLPIRAPIVSASENAGVNTSLNVPGLVNISSDGEAHSVTIATLCPEAYLVRLSAPKISTQVSLTATVKNTSEYTLLAGPSSVYLDGAFIAKSKIPRVSPYERFVCGLGFDPTIRVTYQDKHKKGLQSGILTKTTTTSFLRNITVHNTRSIPIEGLKIIDQIPVSQDAQITVKLVTPGLPAPGTTPESTTISKVPVKVSAGTITAQWYFNEDAEDDKDAWENAGMDGRLAWICSIPAQKKVEFSLAWDVTAPSQTAEIEGLPSW